MFSSVKMVKVMSGRKTMLAVASIFLVALMLSGFASAETLNFSETDTSGDVLQGSVDIVKIGAYTQGSYQYFYAEFREPGIAHPTEDQGTTEMEVIVEVNKNGEDITEYLEITLVWTNSSGEITHVYGYTVNQQDSSMIPDDDVIVDGARVTVKVPTLPLSDVSVMNVEFASTVFSPYAGDTATYYTNSGSNGGSNGEDEGGSSYTGPDESMFGLFAFAGIAICWAVLIIIWIVLAIWVYKDAKKRNMDNPVLWLIITLLLGLIGLIIYLVVRPKEPVQQNYYAPPPPPE